MDSGWSLHLQLAHFRIGLLMALYPMPYDKGASFLSSHLGEVIIMMVEVPLNYRESVQKVLVSQKTRRRPTAESSKLLKPN